MNKFRIGFAGIMALAYAFGIFPGAVLAQTGLLDGAARAQVDGSTSANVDLDAPVSDDNSGTSADDETVNQDSSDTTVSAGVDAGTTLRLNKTDASVKSSSNTNVEASTVSTTNDVEAFAASTIRSHESVEGVDAGTDHVTVSFSERGRILGIFPVAMTSKVVARADGSVKIERPWYSFLTWGDRAELSGDLEARVRAALENDGALTAEGTLSTRAQAVLMDEIARAVSGTSATADASADASIEAILQNSMKDDGTADQGTGDNSPTPQ